MLVSAIYSGKAYAIDTYHNNWAQSPNWGNHWWLNYTSSVNWESHSLWTNASAMRSTLYHFQFENEAYNPGSGTSCDRLHVNSVTNINVPWTGWIIFNGCRSSAWSEELKVYLDETAILDNVWYRYYVGYTKSGSCPGSGEVNYSLGWNLGSGDDWLGKLTYDPCLGKTGSDRPSLFN
jgi:hypothetical protein